MTLNLAQTKFVGLTMKLELKAREYKKLCNALDKYKKEGIKDNTEELQELLDKFRKNNDEIVQIKKELKKIESIKEDNIEEYNYNDIFKKSKHEKNDISYEDNQNLMIVPKENFIEKLIRKIKSLFIQKKER